MTTSNHLSDDALSAALDRELGEDQRAHLDTCADCSAALERWARARSLVSVERPVAPAELIDRSVSRAIEEAAEPEAARSSADGVVSLEARRNGMGKTIAAAAAAIVVVAAGLGVGLTLDHGSGSGTASTGAASSGSPTAKSTHPKAPPLGSPGAAKSPPNLQTAADVRHLAEKSVNPSHAAVSPLVTHAPCEEKARLAAGGHAGGTFISESVVRFRGRRALLLVYRTQKVGGHAVVTTPDCKALLTVGLSPTVPGR